MIKFIEQTIHSQRLVPGTFSKHLFNLCSCNQPFTTFNLSCQKSWPAGEEVLKKLPIIQCITSPEQLGKCWRKAFHISSCPSILSLSLSVKDFIEASSLLRLSTGHAHLTMQIPFLPTTRSLALTLHPSYLAWWWNKTNLTVVTLDAEPDSIASSNSLTKFPSILDFSKLS